MNSRYLGTVATLVAAVLLGGCGKAPPEEPDGPPKPRTVAFEGKVDSKFVGSWKTTNGRSALDLRKDGSLTISSLIATPSGDRKSNIAGSWLASDGNLLLKYSKTGQPDTTLSYTATLAGNDLTLVETGGKLKNVYHRNSAVAKQRPETGKS